MDKKLLEEIHHDLNHVVSDDDYVLSWRPGQPLRVTWERAVHGNTRQFAEELIRTHGVKLEAEDRAPAKTRRAARKKVSGGSRHSSR